MAVRYTEDHEWLNVEGDIATVGITHHAQDALGDVVFVDLPEIGRSYAQKDIAGVVESVKAASDVYSPVSGEVVEANGALEEDPALVNSDAEEDGWFFKLRLTDASELESLMDEAAYTKFVAGL